MMSRNLILAAVFVTILLGAGIWWFQSQRVQITPAPSPARPKISESVSPSPSPKEGKVLQIEVEGYEYYFSPSKLSLKAGEKVKITFRNNGVLPHNLTITDLGIASKTIGPKQMTSLEFTAQKSGSFSMFCSVGNHRALGMEGDVRID